MVNHMKRCIFIIFSILLFFPIIVLGKDFDTYSQNIIFYNRNDSSILYEKNAHERISIASMTKIMTAIICLESIENLDEHVILKYEDFYGLVEANASQAGFYAGEEVTYRDLLNGLLLPSGADAAQALTRLVANGKDEFVSMMNEKAKELELKDTHFANPTGLDDPENYSTVYDVSLMFEYALKNPDFVTIISQRYYTTSNGRLRLRSTIQRMYDLYDIELPYLIGGKSGTTGDAGLCLASVASRDGVDYLLVTARAPFSKTNPSTLYDAKQIYEYYMDHFSYQTILDKKDLLVKIPTLYTKDVDSLDFYSTKEISKYLDNEFTKDRLTFQYEGLDVLTSKNHKGEEIGKVSIYDGDKFLDEVSIVLNQDLKFSIWKWIFNHKYLVIIPILCIIGGIFLLNKTKKRV